MSDQDLRRTQLRDVLERANIEVKAALDRVDSMGVYELAEFRGLAGGLVAIFDKNGTCAPGAGGFNPVAFFDKNGTCAADELRRFDPVAFFDKNGHLCNAVCDPPGRLAVAADGQADDRRGGARSPEAS